MKRILAFIERHLPAFVFLFFFVVYASTAQRGVSWQDSGEFQYRAIAGDWSFYSGIARAYFPYVFCTRALAHCFPLTLQPFAVTLFSGICMAFALAMLCALMQNIGKNKTIAVMTAVLLGFTHMVWWLSCVAEVYTFSLACLITELFLLEHSTHRGKTLKSLLALFAVNGFHLSVHNFALLGLPVYGLYLLWKIHKRDVPAVIIIPVALCWFAGGSVVWTLFIRECISSGDFAAALQSLLFARDFTGEVLGRHSFRPYFALMNYAIAAIGLMNPIWLFAFAKGKGSRPSQVLIVCLAGLSILHFAFWSRYFVPDQATFILPCMALLAIWTGLGLLRLSPKKPYALQLLLLSVIFQIAVPAVLAKALEMNDFGLLKGKRELPFRKEMAYWILPWKMHENSAEQFAKAVDKQLAEGDLLVADMTPGNPLLTARATDAISGKWNLLSCYEPKTFHAPTMEEIKEAVEKSKRTFLVSPRPGYAISTGFFLSDNFNFRKEGILWRAEARHEDNPAH